MKKKWQRLLTVLMTAQLLLACLPMGVRAEEDPGERAGIQVLANPDMQTILSYVEVFEGCEESVSYANWEEKSALENIRIVRPTGEGDLPAVVEGERMLKVTGSRARPNISRTTGLVYAIPLEVSEWNGLFFSLYVPGCGVEDLQVKVQIHTDDENSYTWEAAITPDCWNGVCLNLTGLPQPRRIDEIRIGVRGAFTTDMVDIHYYLDCFGTSAEADLAAAYSFLSGSYTLYGGSSTMRFTQNPESLELNFNTPAATQCFLETPILPAGRFAGANSIRLRLENNSACSALLCEFSTDNEQLGYTEFPAQRVTLRGHAGIQTCTIPLPSQAVNQIKITFEGASSGGCTIYSVLPYLNYTPLSAVGYTLNSCRIEDSHVLLEGSFAEEVFNAYRGGTLSVYEQTTDGGVLSQALASAAVDREFSLKFPLYDEQRSRIASSFVVMLSYANQNLAVGTPVYITNPEAAGLAAASWSYPTSASKKGMVTTSAMAMETNLTHTVVTVDLARLFSAGNGFLHSFEGNNYTFSEAYILQLDRALTDCRVADVSATLSLELSLPADSALTAMLVSPDADLTGGAEGYAFNVSDQAGVNALRAACDFLARRYMSDQSRYGRAVGIICGSGIDGAAKKFSSGSLTLREYVDRYSRMFRIVFNTVRSISPKAAVYIGLGNSWDGKLSASAAQSYPGRDVLEMFSRQIRAEGDIPWRLVLDPYSADSGCLTDWSSAVLPGESVSFPALGALCSQLKQDIFLYQGGARSILLVNDTPVANPDITNDQWTAEYIAAYYTVCTSACSAVQSLILYDQSQVNRANDGLVEVLKYVDTASSAEICSPYKLILGIDAWNELIPEYKSGSAGVRQFVEAEMTEALPDNILGGAPVWSFTAETQGEWEVSAAGTSQSYRESYKGYRDMLLTAFGQTDASAVCAVASVLRYSRDLSIAPYLSFNIYTDNLPDGVRDLTLHVTVVGDNGVYRASADFRGGVWKYLVCDLSGFSAAKSVRQIILHLSADNGVPLNGTTFVVGEITASSAKYDSDFLAEKFQEEREKYLSPGRAEQSDRAAWILIGIIVGAATLEILYILSRIRTKTPQTVKYDIDEDFFR